VLDADGHAMLTDFGLSKEGITNNSSAKSFCGSVAYLAPEVLKRRGHGKSVDWYLVGVLLYEMLVGIPPYFSSNKDQMFKNIKEGPLRMPERLGKDTKDFIIKLLNKNPAKRLGAGKKDAEELKTHPFFEGINWEDVLDRKLEMPKPELKEVKKSTQINLPEIVYGEYAGVGQVAASKKREFEEALHLRGQVIEENPDADDLDRNKIPGWSFIAQ
jgi:serine/threonine protein kinase